MKLHHLVQHRFKAPDFLGLLHFRRPFEGGHALPLKDRSATGHDGPPQHLEITARNAKDSFREITRGLYSLFTGMRVTLAEFFKPPVTVQYPRETIKMPARFRGHIELVRDSETGKALCIACKLCERACPTDCITVEGIKKEGDKRKSVTDFQLDFSRCSLCGSCVEACKSSAIRFSKEYNLASVNQEDFAFNLLKRLEQEAQAATPAPPAA
jgi:NADH-quinone oxidoreductase subunit I